MDGKIIPLKQRKLHGKVKSIILNRPDNRFLPLMACYTDYSEIEALLKEGWVISKQQMTFNGWLKKDGTVQK